MPRMLDVSDDVRAEIGDEEADRLLAGENAPGSYDCTSCRTPGDAEQERTSTVLFVGQETAVLAFAHASCVPSQVVPVSEEQLQGAVASITGEQHPAAGSGAPAGAAAGVPSGMPHGGPAGGGLGGGIDGGLGTGPGGGLGGGLPDAGPPLGAAPAAPRQAVLNVTCGLVLLGEEPRPALVVEPTAPIARPGSTGPGDEFLQLLLEQGFAPLHDLNAAPPPVPGWSVLMAAGQLHTILMPTAGGGQMAWWQAHRPMPVTDGWRTAVNKAPSVLVYAAPVGSIGSQPREDQLREALERTAARGLLVAAVMPLSGT
ncbi:hypothetical protein IHE55_04780 [Streptomyces pactum]|uniref:Uncharacterized protein n=1 Tax=Streptomyces pactum TaxID=68249 RepID=A0ABS0NG30_9ACTN|nr:hypothetical protein [Streptomyces pactum]MBH5334153.1 hypothetical protein [Streptomyces pactum]